MLEYKNQKLVFSFPEVHKDAELEVVFVNTFRLPEDGITYNLPPGISAFDMLRIEEYKDKVPESWKEHGGVFIPMYNAEAMYLQFTCKQVSGKGVRYPFAVKVASGKRSAVSGKVWTKSLRNDDYLILPDTRWLDGFATEEGIIKQFVGISLDSGATVEEQITKKKVEVGGLQIQVFPMYREIFEKKFPTNTREVRIKRSKVSTDSSFIKCGTLCDSSTLDYMPVSDGIEDICESYSSSKINVIDAPKVYNDIAIKVVDAPVACCAVVESSDSNSFRGLVGKNKLSAEKSLNWFSVEQEREVSESETVPVKKEAAKELGFGAGGKMAQQIFKDKYGVDSWDQTVSDNRCFIHLCNIQMFEEITGKKPGRKAISMQQYKQYGYKWYDYYVESKVIGGGDMIKDIKSVSQMEKELDKKIISNEDLAKSNNVQGKHAGAIILEDGKW